MISPWRPQFVFDRESFVTVSRYGLPLLGSQTLNYWVRNIDKLLIGKTFGDESLGYYSKPYNIMLFPLNNVTRVVARVLFPSFSKIQDDKQLVTNSFLRVIGMVALLTFPISVGGFVMAEPIIIGLYTESWAGSVDILRVLSLLGVSQSIVALNGVIYQAQGATMLQFKWGIIFKIITVASIALALPFGVMAIAICYSVVSTLLTIPKFWVVGKVIPVRLAQVCRVCLGPALASVAMGSGVFLYLYLMGDKLSQLALLCSGVPIGAALYGAICFGFKFQAIQDYLEFIRNRKTAS